MIVARSHKISPYCFTGIIDDWLAILVPLEPDGNRIRRTGHSHPLDRDSLLLVEPNRILVKIRESLCRLAVKFVKTSLKNLTNPFINDFLYLQSSVNRLSASEPLSHSHCPHFGRDLLRMMFINPYRILFRRILAGKSLLGVSPKLFQSSRKGVPELFLADSRNPFGVKRTTDLLIFFGHIFQTAPIDGFIVQRSPRCKLSLPVCPSLVLCHIDVSCADLVLCLEGDENVAQLFFRLSPELIQRNRRDKAVLIVAVLVKELVLQSLDNAVPVSGA